MCFSFKIEDADADSYDVSTAVLWLFKSHRQKNTKRQENLLNQMIIEVSEVQQQKLKSKFLPVIKTIAIQSVNVHGKWIFLYTSTATHGRACLLNALVIGRS